jgi:hypothetical protein
MFTPAIRAILPSLKSIQYRKRDRLPVSTLTLLVARVFANDPHDASAPDDLAVPTHLFYGSTDFHLFVPL